MDLKEEAKMIWFLLFRFRRHQGFRVLIYFFLKHSVPQLHEKVYITTYIDVFVRVAYEGF
jgi:hypothetical protein